MVAASGSIFSALVRPRILGPIALVASIGLIWWANAAYRLTRQIAQHAPVTLSLTDAAKQSRDGEIYVRLTDMTVYCGHTFLWGFGRAMALVDANGQVAALGHFEKCPKSTAGLEGVFLEPPYGLYGEVVNRGWNVTEGHLAFFEPDVHASRASTRIAIALISIPLLLASFLAALRAERGIDRNAWRLRALGFLLMAGISWYFYYSHELAYLGVIPATWIAALALAAALGFVVFPKSAYMRRVGQRLVP